MTDDNVKMPCCDDWALAHKSETDNEGVGPLVYYDAYSEEDPYMGSFRCGTDGPKPPRVQFCPWCSASKAKME